MIMPVLFHRCAVVAFGLCWSVLISLSIFYAVPVFDLVDVCSRDTTSLSSVRVTCCCL